MEEIVKEFRKFELESIKRIITPENINAAFIEFNYFGHIHWLDKDAKEFYVTCGPDSEPYYIVKIVDPIVKPYSHTFLSIACENAAIDVIDYLLENGADPSICDCLGKAINSRNYDAVQRILNHGVDINVKRISGTTLLQDAIIDGQYDTATLLIGFGATVEIEEGYDALRCAVFLNEREALYRNSELIHREMFQFLMQYYNKDVFEQVLMNRDYPTHLDILWREEEHDLLKMLLDAGIDPNLGETSFYERCGGNIKIAEILINYGMKISNTEAIRNINDPDFVRLICSRVKPALRRCFFRDITNLESFKVLLEYWKDNISDVKYFCIGTCKDKDILEYCNNL